MQAMPSLCVLAGESFSTRAPLMAISPPSGWCAPVMILMSVDLPAPFSPSSAWTSPACKSNDTPLSARTAPKDLATDESWSRSELILGALAQNIFLVAFHFVQPPVADGNAVL